jgi:hypothetical protein
MRNYSVLGRSLGLLLGLVLPAALLGVTGCQGTMTANDPNYRPIDSRRGMGNLLVGTLCDNRNACPNDSKNLAVPCLSAHQYDTVGICAPGCATDSDCDTYLPGLAKCTNMGGAPECVLFCDQQHVNTSKDCPTKWTCELVPGPLQAFYMCVPPQTPLPAPDM